MNNFLIFLLMAMFLFGNSTRQSRKRAAALARVRSWVCVYQSDALADDVVEFDLAVLDADSHPDLEEIRWSRTLLIGYLSLAEVGSYRWFWNEIAEAPWVLDKNPNWDGFMIDVRQREWHDMIINKVIPPILAKGFDGLFLDTIDTAEYLEQFHPEKKYPGAKTAMVRLIRAIRKHYPKIILIANRGFGILNEIGPSIDAVVAESVFTNIEPANEKTFVRMERDFQAQIIQIKNAVKKFKLRVFSLDYFMDQTDERINKVINLAHSHNFVPYVSTPNLDKIHFHATIFRQ